MVLPVDAARRRSVIDEPIHEETPLGQFVFWLGSIADDIVPWGGASSAFRARNAQLRNFWTQEPTLASALYTITIRDASFSWTIKGDQPLTVKATQEMLHNANLGKGWLDFIQKWRTDFLTQDNGAFFEVIRRSDAPSSPVLGINHLDSGLCRRTGVADWPVIYTDRRGIDHKMRPWQVVATADWPSPIETANGMGFCAVSRVLRQAQFMRDVGIRDRERSSGADPKSLHIVSGVTRAELDTAISGHKEVQLDQGYIRYNKPIILSNVDPSKPATHDTLDLAPRPDQWDINTVQTWYITLLAMALGVDYQDLAPLPSRGIGGSMQSMILHEKAKGKGPELFMKTIEHILNFHGVIPQNVEFAYDEKDPAGEKETADLFVSYSDAGQKYVDSGVLSAQGVRNILLDEGLISQEIYDIESQGAEDATEEVQAEEDTKPLQQPGGQSADVRTPEGEKARSFSKVTDFFHNFEHDPSGLTHCIGSESNPYKIEHIDGKHMINLRYARGHGKGNKPQWFHFPTKLAKGFDLESGVKIDTPEKNLWNSTKENLASFDEAERKRWEAEMFRDMNKALDSLFKDLKKAILPKKATPDNIVEREKFWLDFRKKLTTAMAPNARQIFLGVAEYNESIGLAVNMDAMNVAAHEFTRTYTTAWLEALEGTTRDGLRQAILTWQEGGLGTEGLPDLVKSIEPWFNEARAQRIAQTETTRVFDLGNKASHGSAGIEYEQWQTANDDLVREEHQEFQGQVFPLDDGPRPSDYINCRCARVPIPTEEALALLGRQ